MTFTSDSWTTRGIAEKAQLFHELLSPSHGANRGSNPRGDTNSNSNDITSRSTEIAENKLFSAPNARSFLIISNHQQSLRNYQFHKVTRGKFVGFLNPIFGGLYDP